MSKATDPALFGSEYERNRLDRYWTNPWMTKELLKHLSGAFTGPIWECAAGRGDMSRALRDGVTFDVYSSDIDMSEFDEGIGPGHEHSFLDEFEIPVIGRIPCQSIITNPPYSEPWRGIADDFVEHGLGFFDQGIDFMAMLMRSEFSSGKSKRRRLKFGECEHFMGELTLTTRPRWDYGDPDAPENAAPRHNFSWFLWSKDWKVTHPHPIQIFSYMPKGFKP
jgi:hypothetical protein